MAYMTAVEVKEGLARLGIVAIAADCEPEQGATLVDYDRRRVSAKGKDGVLISYHLEDADPNETLAVFVAFSYPELHHPAPHEIQEILNSLLGQEEQKK